MDLDNTIIRLILVVIIVFVMSTAYLIGLENARPPAFPKVIVLTNIPDAASIRIDRPQETEQGWEWPHIQMSIDVKYSTELKENLEVVPIMTFNGEEKKATVVNGQQESATFPMTKENPEFSGSIKVDNIVTKEGPIFCGAPVSDIRDFKPGTKYLFQPPDGRHPNFTLQLIDISKGKGEKLSEKLQSNCGETFVIECYNRLYLFDLFQMDDVCKNGLVERCEKSISLCNSTITITGNRIDCSRQEADITINSELHTFDKVFEVGEVVGVTFFKKSPCVDQLESVKEMRRNCGSDFLGGTYYFKDGIPSRAENKCR
ncbi:MAG: hypothetical protein HY514_00385 [Candidatus Aenigmarchaeota archaeon]|nr:hypothetical protein [Candidatus Aenigmarchaeota archaeon]